MKIRKFNLSRMKPGKRKRLLATMTLEERIANGCPPPKGWKPPRKEQPVEWQSWSQTNRVNGRAERKLIRYQP